MADLSPLLGEERKSDFGAVRSVEVPKRTSWRCDDIALAGSRRLLSAADCSDGLAVSMSWFALETPSADLEVSKSAHI